MKELGKLGKSFVPQIKIWGFLKLLDIFYNHCWNIYTWCLLLFLWCPTHRNMNYHFKDYTIEMHFEWLTIHFNSIAVMIIHCLNIWVWTEHVYRCSMLCFKFNSSNSCELLLKRTPSMNRLSGGTQIYMKDSKVKFGFIHLIKSLKCVMIY